MLDFWRKFRYKCRYYFNIFSQYFSPNTNFSLEEKSPEKYAGFFLPLRAAKAAVAVVATGLRPREAPAESTSLSTSLSAQDVLPAAAASATSP
jgi:hypothetical protein